MTLEGIKEILEYKIIDLDKFSLTPYDLLMLLIVLAGTRLFLWALKKIIYRLNFKSDLDLGRRSALYQIVKYVVIVIAISIGLETIGIKVTILLAGSAALLVGVGLGLQEFFKDIFSGIILLLEGTIKVGDVLEVDGIVCEVNEIGIRASEVTTREDIMMIIPNSKFINHSVVNWTHSSDNTRFHLTVGVAYGSDVEKVQEILEKCADEHPSVTKNPKPLVRFSDFGTSSLDFDLYFHSNSVFRVENVKSELRFMIDKEFRNNNVIIPFPQRDLHIVSDIRQQKK